MNECVTITVNMQESSNVITGSDCPCPCLRISLSLSFPVGLVLSLFKVKELEAFQFICSFSGHFQLTSPNLVINMLRLV